MDLESLKYSVDSDTGKVKYPSTGGIFQAIRDGGREFVYMTGSFGMAQFKKLVNDIYGTNPLSYFDGLLDFKYFQPMTNYDTADILEKKAYMYCRESEIREMKRLRAYIQKEEDFYYQYL